MAKTVSLSRREVVDHIYDYKCIGDNDKSLLEATQTVKHHYQIQDEVLDQHIIPQVSDCVYKIKQKWKACHRIKDVFNRKHSKWLEGNISSDDLEAQLQNPISTEDEDDVGQKNY